MTIKLWHCVVATWLIGIALGYAGHSIGPLIVAAGSLVLILAVMMPR